MRQLVARMPSRSYEIFVGHGALDELGQQWRRLAPDGRAWICCDENVAPLHLERVEGVLRAAGVEVRHEVIRASESEKRLATAERLYGRLYRHGWRRSDGVVALGGGVIGDLVGFVAATFLRGLRLVQAPTTLLAQVDAAVGGKVAVDFDEGKNYVGTFYQPWLVVADLDVLATLPAREVRNGRAEVAKYGLLVGGGLLEAVEASVAGDEALPENVAADCVAYKVGIVGRDEREEGGERALLNLGHTVGHAIEAGGGFALYSHGEAVALGLRAMLWLSERLAGLGHEEAERGQALLSACGLPERLEGLDPAVVVPLIARDKKAGAEGVEYVLLEDLGKPTRGARVPVKLAREAVRWLTER